MSRAPVLPLIGLTLAGVALAQSPPLSNADWIRETCKSREKLPGFVRCSGVDSGVTPASASYQPLKVGPFNASREAVNYLAYGGQPYYRVPLHVKGFSTQLKRKDDGTRPVLPKSDLRDAACAEEATGLASTKPKVEFPRVQPDGTIEESGYPLGLRFKQLIGQRFGEGSDLYRWTRDTWLPKHEPKTETRRDSSGSCHLWAPWSLDRNVLTSLKDIQGGIMCGDFPLSFAEIKEIYYQLWAEAGGAEHKTSVRTEAFFQGEGQEDLSGGTLVRPTMDANVALAKIGAMGVSYQGPAARHEGIDPSKVVADFRAAVSSVPPKAVTFDRDHGEEIWNQPAAAMVEVVYQSGEEAADLLATTDFEAVGGDPSLAELQAIERDLILALTQGTGLRDRSRLEALAGRTLGAGATLEQQADLINAAKRRLLVDQKIAAKRGNGLKVERREVIIYYGEETPFAAPVADRLSSRSYPYTSVTDASGNIVRSSWNPPLGKLSELCAQPEPQFLGFSGWNARYECCRLRKGDVDDYTVFTGAVPPRRISVHPEFKPDLRNPAAEPYFQFRIMLMGEAAFDNAADLAEARRRFGLNGQLQPACPSFAQAELLGNLFNQRVREGAPITAEDRARMVEWARQSAFLNEQWVGEKLCKSAHPGAAELRADLKAAGRDLCP